MTLEELIARILRDLREKAEAQFGGADSHARWWGVQCASSAPRRRRTTRSPKSRLREAFQIAGYESVEFELEPVAAAHYYESTLDHDELILIGDFGGGTSDFSLLRVGPGDPQTRPDGRRTLLGNSGRRARGRRVRCQDRAQPGLTCAGTRVSARSMDKMLPPCRTGCTPSWSTGTTSRSCAPTQC